MRRNSSLIVIGLTVVFLGLSATPPVRPPTASAQGQSNTHQASDPFASEIFQRGNPKFIRDHSFDNPKFRKRQEANPARGEAAEDTKEVRMIYLVPRDKAPREKYRAAMANAILHVQNFFQSQLGSSHNFSTFSIHNPVVEVYTTAHDASFYSSFTGSPFGRFFEAVLLDGFAVSGGGFNDPNYRWIYYIDADNACDQAIGGNAGVALLGINDLKGLTGEPGLICGAAPFTPCRWIGGLGHELAHTWLVPHPPGCGVPGGCSGGSFAENSLMWVGYASYPGTYLLDADKSQLLNPSNAAFFTPIPPLGSLSDCHVNPSLQFSAASLSFNESSNSAVITVTRTGEPLTAASVDYATSDGSASERSDYLAAAGKLHFASGETSKTITIFLVNDAFGEGAETFTLNLSNPIGCTLGPPANVTITINSDESVNGLNPVKDAGFVSDFFVRQHYTDFFNREADAPGLAFWKNQIDSCGLDLTCREIRKINVSAAFYVSGEFQETGYLVYKANQAAFNSGEQLKLSDFLPDLQEIGRDVVIGQPGAEAQLEANKQKFFMDFVQRPKFLEPGAFPSTMSAGDFVDKLNANTFDPRNPGSGGSLSGVQRSELITQLAAHTASASLRAQVLRAIVENSLFSNRQFNKAFVLMQYFGYMRRNPNDAPEPGLDFAGYNFWLGKLNDFNGNYISAEMVKAFITSGEYQHRFGP